MSTLVIRYQCMWSWFQGVHTLVYSVNFNCLYQTTIWLFLFDNDCEESVPRGGGHISVVSHFVYLNRSLVSLGQLVVWFMFLCSYIVVYYVHLLIDSNTLLIWEYEMTMGILYKYIMITFHCPCKCACTYALGGCWKSPSWLCYR